MNRLSIILFLLSIQFSLVGQLLKPEEAIKICSYNIHYDKKNDSLRSWDARRNMVLDIIKTYDFDVACLQEVSQSQLADFLKMENYGTIGEGINGGTSGVQNTILYKKERLELLESGVFWLSPTPEFPSQGWDATYFRNCTWGKFRDKITQYDFYIYNAHFDHYGEEARLNSAYLISSVIKKNTNGLPAFFMGDLNSTEDSETITLLNSRLSDARNISLSVPQGPVGTGHGFRINNKVRRIDYIFVSKQNVMISDFETIDKLYNGKAPSDHWPIYVKAYLNQ